MKDLDNVVKSSFARPQKLLEAETRVVCLGMFVWLPGDDANDRLADYCDIL